MKRPLRHVRILDLSCFLAGPFATQLLADLGARVLKLEPPGGDPARRWASADGVVGAHFACANRGKLARSLDLRTEAGRTELAGLLRDQDVLVEGFHQEQAEALGLTRERLRESHPGLIVASVRGFASDVPAHRRHGYDAILQAESGWMSLTGEACGPPQKAGPPGVDLVGALYLANAIQAALLHRDRTGEALHVEVPLMEAALAALGPAAAETLLTGRAPSRSGNRHPVLAPHECFPCLDGPVALGVGNDAQFEILALWLGLDLEARPAWRTNPGRVQDREALASALGEALGRKPLTQVLAFCEAHAIPASPIRTLEDALLRQAGHLHHLIQPLLDLDTRQMVPVLASPILLDDERACAQLPPPGWKG